MAHDNNISELKGVINWILGAVAPSAWWLSKNIDLINKYVEFGLKSASFVSFCMLIIINRRTFIRELKKMFNNCPDEEVERKN